MRGTTGSVAIIGRFKTRHVFNQIGVSSRRTFGTILGAGTSRRVDVKLSERPVGEV